MTDEKPTPEQIADRERLLKICEWLRDVGVCGFCRLGIAIAMVERERKRGAVIPASCGKTGRDRNGVKIESCAALQRLHWDKRPRLK